MLHNPMIVACLCLAVTILLGPYLRLGGCSFPWVEISEGGFMDYFIVRHLRSGILSHTEDQYSVMSVEEIMADENVELASESYKTKSQAIAAMASLK